MEPGFKGNRAVRHRPRTLGLTLSRYKRGYAPDARGHFWSTDPVEVKDTRWKLFRVMAMLMQATGRYQFGGGSKHLGFMRERSWASESFYEQLR